MTEKQARTLIESLTDDQKCALLRLLNNLGNVKNTEAAYQAGLRAGSAIKN